jgi:hypothetical protein
VGIQRARPHLNLVSQFSKKRLPIKSTEKRGQPGGKNEKENVVSLGVAFGRLFIRRMRNASRHGGGYTEPRERLEKDSFGVG